MALGLGAAFSRKCSSCKHFANFMELELDLVKKNPIITHTSFNIWKEILHIYVHRNTRSVIQIFSSKLIRASCKSSGLWKWKVPRSGFDGELVSIPKNLMDGTTLTMIVYSEITLKPKEEEKRRKKKNGFGGKKVQFSL